MRLAKTYKEIIPLSLKSNYLRESILSIEIVRFARSFGDLIKVSKDKNADEAEI